MSTSMTAFLAGLGGGLLQGHDRKKRDEREAKEDAWRDEQRDRQRKEDAEKDKLKQDLADAAAPRTTMQGTVTDGGSNRYLNTDPAQAASMQETLAAEAELKGEPAPTQQAGTGVVGAMSRGNEITTEPVDTSKVNSADARNERVLGALRSNGQVERAMSMETNILDQQAKRLGLDAAQAKFADEQFNRKLTERLSTPNWGEEAAKMLDETEVGSLAGVTVTSRPTKDGKSIELVGVRDGKEKVVGTFENSDAGRAKFMQQVARVPLEAKIGWIVESEKSAREEQRWQQTFDFNKKKEENDQQYRNRVLSIQMAQESRARQTHALAMEDAKIPPAVKLQAQTLAKQMETINTALSKAMAEGMFDPNNPSSADLIKQQRVLSLKYQNLLTPYTPGAKKNADPLGLGGGESQPAGASPAAPAAAAPAASPAIAPTAAVGPGGGAMPPAAAPAAAPAPAKAQPTVAQVLAGSSAEPNPYGASVYGVEFDAENEIMEASTVRPGENPADVSPDMADVWIDVSSLPQGSGLGEIIYSAAANFAHNTGRVFIGDPNGLSAVALRRRTEQMISSALKFGTTDHLAPHPDQVKGDNAAGVPALRWVYGDSEGNIERMIDVSLQSIENALPSAKLIGYDAASNKFFRTDTGARLPFRSAIAGVVNAQSLGRAIDGQRPDGLGRAADRAGQGVDAGAASAGSAGWRTVARAALFRYLREAQGVAADGADRGSLLDRLRDAGARLGREGPVASGGASAEPIFYSRSAGNSNGLSAETGARFSRSLTESINNVRSMALPAGYVVNDLFQSTGKLSWWNKTVGTMYNLAQRERDFKPVFDKAQEFLNDVAFYAAEASNLAPKILPKLETLKDITKSPISAADNKAISAPIFEGTLTWMRDPSTRKPITMEEAEAKAAAMTTEQKAGELVRKGMLAPEVLKMWQGQPVDQYTAMVADRYERDMLNAGIVWTDAELKGQFKLSDDQVALYREFRAAVDKSLSTLAIADMVRFGGQDVQPVRELALEAESVDAAAKLLRDFLLAEAEADPARKRVLTDTADRMLDKAAKANSLMERGYAPLSRFGRYSLDVVDAGGERVYFGLFESQAQANKMARQMRGNFPKATITQGTVSQEAYKMFAGVSPETLELFGQLVGLEAKGEGAQNEVFQQYLKNAKSQRSAMKRLIQRKGISGFSEDPGRVLAGFVYSNARQTSSSLHMGELATAVDEIPKTKGELKDMAVKLNDYVKNPQEEAQALRGLLFAQYLGGSVSSALLNALQPVQVTFPWLSQFGGAIKAASRMQRAIGDVLARRELEPALAKALKKAEEDGVVSPQEVFQLQAQAAGRAPLLASDGTRLGAAGAAANNTLSRVTLAWGKLFGAAEQFNRRSTYIAAYRTAVEQGMPHPEKFAERAVYETQFVYSKANRPQWARGAVGATLFTFKQYSISYVELMHRMYTQGGPEGKKAALLGIGVLFLMSGLGGLPFNDDLEDLIDGFMQRVMNRNFSTKQAKQEFFTKLLGADVANFLERGVSGLPGAPIDVSGRLGLGNLIPGTGVFQKKDDYSRDLLEIVGPAGDFAKRGGQAAGKALQGEVLGARGALATVSPVAARNAIKGWEMATTGMYLDDKGRKVLDSSGMDALFKSIGIQPAGVAQVQESVFEVQRQISLNKMRETEIANKWAMGVFRKDSDLVREARSELAAWNRDNPSTPIVIKMPQILKRVRQMNLNKADRIAKTAPTEIRSQVREELREAQR